jgi:hypothetical protein
MTKPNYFFCRVFVFLQVLAEWEPKDMLQQVMC